MTANQIAFWNYREGKRHNLEYEKESNRHNVVTEVETERSHRANEAIGRQQANASTLSAQAAWLNAQTQKSRSYFQNLYDASRSSTTPAGIAGLIAGGTPTGKAVAFGTLGAVAGRAAGLKGLTSVLPMLSSPTQPSHQSFDYMAAHRENPTARWNLSNDEWDYVIGEYGLPLEIARQHGYRH